MSFSKIKESPKEEVNAIVILYSLISNKGKERKVQSFSLLLKSELNYGSFWWSPQIRVSVLFGTSALSFISC